MTSPPPDNIHASQQSAARQRLIRDWLITAAVAIIALFVVALLLSSQWVMVAVGRWAIIAGLAIFYELRIFRQTLDLMHAPGEDALRPGVDDATRWALLSGLSYALLAGFLMVTSPAGWLGWLPPLLALAGAVAAAFAETIALRSEARTVGGDYLAREFLALGALSATAVAIHYGKLDPWFLLIGIMDYLLLFTRGWLARKKKNPPALPSTKWRFHFQSLYLAALGVILFPTVGRDYALPTGLLAGLPIFFISLRDWFILTGLLNPEQSQYRQLAGAVNRALTGWLALSIRLLGAMAAATIAADMIFHFDIYARAFAQDLYAGAVALMLLVVLPFLLLGIRARLFAFIAFAALSIILLVMGWSQIVFIALLLTGATIILGQGQLAVEKES